MMDPLCTLLRFRKLQLYIEKQFEDGSTSEQLVSIPKTAFGHNSTAAHLPIAFASVPRSLYLAPPYCSCTFLRAAFCLYTMGRRGALLGCIGFWRLAVFYFHPDRRSGSLCRFVARESGQLLQTCRRAPLAPGLPPATQRPRHNASHTLT